MNYKTMLLSVIFVSLSMKADEKQHIQKMLEFGQLIKANSHNILEYRAMVNVAIKDHLKKTKSIEQDIDVIIKKYTDQMIEAIDKGNSEEIHRLLDKYSTDADSYAILRLFTGFYVAALREFVLLETEYQELFQQLVNKEFYKEHNYETEQNN